jgi:hypothetical protein
MNVHYRPQRKRAAPRRGRGRILTYIMREPTDRSRGRFRGDRASGVFSSVVPRPPLAARRAAMNPASGVSLLAAKESDVPGWRFPVALVLAALVGFGVCSGAAAQQPAAPASPAAQPAPAVPAAAPDRFLHRERLEQLAAELLAGDRRGGGNGRCRLSRGRRGCGWLLRRRAGANAESDECGKDHCHRDSPSRHVGLLCDAEGHPTRQVHGGMTCGHRRPWERRWRIHRSPRSHGNDAGSRR